MYPRSILRRPRTQPAMAQLRLPGSAGSSRHGERRVHFDEDVEVRWYQVDAPTEVEVEEEGERSEDDDEEDEEMKRGWEDGEMEMEIEDEEQEIGMEDEFEAVATATELGHDGEEDEDEDLDLGLSPEEEMELDEYIRAPEELTDEEDERASWLGTSNIDPRILNAGAQQPSTGSNIPSTHQTPADIAQQALHHLSTAPSPQAPHPGPQKAPLKDRKRTILYATPPSVLTAMETWMETEIDKIQDDLSLSDCWLHPTAAHLTHHHIISKTFSWPDGSGVRQSLRLQLGTVAMLLSGRLTDEMKRGYVEDSWHLSHLCGNWTCCNYTHFTVEPGPVNVGRNGCFRSSRACGHRPECLKDKKVISALLVPQSDLEVGGAMDAEEEGGEEEEEVDFGPDFFRLDDT